MQCLGLNTSYNIFHQKTWEKQINSAAYCTLKNYRPNINILILNCGIFLNFPTYLSATGLAIISKTSSCLHAWSKIFWNLSGKWISLVEGKKSSLLQGYCYFIINHFGNTLNYNPLIKGKYLWLYYLKYLKLLIRDTLVTTWLYSRVSNCGIQSKSIV